MAKQTNADLLAIIANLTSKVEAMEQQLSETKKKGGKPPVEKVAKLYPKLNGHYFQLNTEIVPEIELTTFPTVNAIANTLPYGSTLNLVVDAL